MTGTSACRSTTAVSSPCGASLHDAVGEHFPQEFKGVRGAGNVARSVF